MLGFRFAAVTELFLRQLSLKVGIEGMEAVKRLTEHCMPTGHAGGRCFAGD